MDVTDLLQKDHRTVESLFSQYKSTQDDATAEQICQELERRTVEETIVYPRLAEIDPELEQHAEEEHATAKQLIAQIRSRPDDVARLLEQLQQLGHERIGHNCAASRFVFRPLRSRNKAAVNLGRLASLVQHHVGEEESKAFPA